MKARDQQMWALRSKQLCTPGPRVSFRAVAAGETGLKAPLKKGAAVDLAEHLKALELELLTNTTRKNADRVRWLLADSFREYGSSGRVYSKDEIVRTLQGEAPVPIQLSGFEMTLVGDGVALVTYRSQKQQSDGRLVAALRSSLWKEYGSDWKMVFHQGTEVTAVAP